LRELHRGSIDVQMPKPLILDIGGEGRHAGAWNLNPRTRRTIGNDSGQPIPRLIRGRGESIPLRDKSVDVLIVERTPLLMATLREMLRVAKPSATAILRHAVTPLGDPHRLALQILQGKHRRRITMIAGQPVWQTVVSL
jgi:hypothetical protein